MIQRICRSRVRYDRLRGDRQTSVCIDKPKRGLCSEHLLCCCSSSAQRDRQERWVLDYVCFLPPHRLPHPAAHRSTTSKGERRKEGLAPPPPRHHAMPPLPLSPRSLPGPLTQLPSTPRSTAQHNTAQHNTASSHQNALVRFARMPPLPLPRPPVQARAVIGDVETLEQMEWGK